MYEPGSGCFSGERETWKMISAQCILRGALLFLLL